MADRLSLDAKLRSLLGSSNVYFQPPSSIRMDYPCIVYKRGKMKTDFANDMPYKVTVPYELTYITKNPDDEMVMAIATKLPMCVHDRHFTSDNLNHDVYTLYY